MSFPSLAVWAPVAAALVLLLAAGPVGADTRLPEPVQQALAAAGLPASSLTFAARPLAHRGRAVGYGAGRVVQPGSTMKLVTSIVALDRLGPNHRGFTELLATTAPRGEVIDGELVLRGGGEVELGVPQLWAMLAELRESGVREIRGGLVLDRSRYSPARADLGLPPFDEAPEFPYNVIPDALNVAGSLLTLQLSDIEGHVVARSLPALDGLVLDASAMQRVEGRCADWDDHWQPAQRQRAGETTQIVLKGGFPRGCSVRAQLQLLDRDELTARLVHTLWRGLGGTLGPGLREGVAPAEAALLVRRQGRPWGELLRPLNKGSDNAWTRVLFHELGAAEPGPEPTAARADRAVRQWLAERGIDAAALVTDNGSGLSRRERVSAELLVQMIAAAWAGPHRHELLMSLPTVGVDGTMRLRLRDSPARGWARLKTGTLRNVVALAGVLRDGEGRDWAVAILINDEKAAQGRPVLDALVDHWARTAPDAPRWAALRIGPQDNGP